MSDTIHGIRFDERRRTPEEEKRAEALHFKTLEEWARRARAIERQVGMNAAGVQ